MSRLPSHTPFLQKITMTRSYYSGFHISGNNGALCPDLPRTLLGLLDVHRQPTNCGTANVPSLSTRQ
jgi:hypothetical protein